LSDAENSEELTGVKVCRDAPIVTHLLFTNDSLTLMEANERNMENLEHILDICCDISGQLVSDAKSSNLPNLVMQNPVEERVAWLVRS
jgi:hypothetical protein